MAKYIVRWLDQNKPLEVEAAYYRIFDGSYERKDVTFYDGHGNPLQCVNEVHRLRIEEQKEQEAARSDVCPACGGIAEKKIFGIILRCSTCHGTGKRR